MKTTGDKIRILRHWLKLSQGEFAQSIGVTLLSVWNWENNTKPIADENIRKIEQKYNIKLDTIELNFEPCYNE